MADNPGATRARTRNRRGEGARLREEIVVAAEQLLDEAGHESAITLRAVARRVGIAAPSIYRHFPDQPAILLEVVQRAFAELDTALRTALDAAGDDPRRRLSAICDGYLDFARDHPERYRTMFGGAWMPALEGTSVTEADMAALGAGSMELLAEILADCAAAGYSDSADPAFDAVALWLGMHGLAHQRAATVAFPWPEGIADRLITALARLTDSGA